MANYRQINPLLISANNSSVGQVLTSNGTAVYWDTGGGGGGASVTVSNTAPGAAVAGDLWWSSEEGTLKIYYEDGDSNQWVDASNPSPSFNAISLTGPISANTITAVYSLTGASLSVTGTAAARDLTITNNISTGSMTVSGALSLGDLVVSTVNAATIVRTPVLNVSNYAIISTLTSTTTNTVNLNVSGNTSPRYILANNSQGTAGQILLSGGSTSNVYWDSASNVFSLNAADQTITKVYTFNANTVFNRNSTFANAVTFSNTISVANINSTYISNTTFNDYKEQTVSNTSFGASYTVDLTKGSLHLLTLTSSTTIYMPTAAQGKSFTLIISTGSGGYTVSWNGVTFSDGVAPVATATSIKKDILSFISDGSSWFGFVAGQNF